MSTQSRTANSVRNISYGLVVTVLSVLVSFVNRTFLVKYLGVEPLGLNGLFTEVIAMMSLAELGVGMAINYSLYKPIHDNDYKKIDQLMSLFRTTYNYIALAIFLIGLLALPFIHLIVNGTDFSVSYIRLIFALFVINSASSYLFSYNTSLINANQKQYVVSMTTTIWKVLFTIINIVFLVLYGNYVLYLVLLIVQTFCTNIYLAHYVRNHYPFISYKDKLDDNVRKGVFQDIKNIFIKRVSGVATSSSTNILISVFVNTIQVGLYSNYIMLFSIVRTLKSQFSNGLKASIGDLSVSEAPDRCISVLNRLTFLFFMFAIIVTGCLLSVSSDFIELWIGKEYIMAENVVFIAIFNLYLELISEPLWQYLEVSGLFRKDKYIGIIGTCANLLIALVCGYFFGIVGIFMGTMATQVIQMILKTIILFKDKFQTTPKVYLWFLLKMILIFGVNLIIIAFVHDRIEISNTYLSFIINTILSLIISSMIGILFFFRSEVLKESMHTLINITCKRNSLNMQS